MQTYFTYYMELQIVKKIIHAKLQIMKLADVKGF